MAYRKAQLWKSQQRGLPIANRIDLWTAFQIYALFQTLQVIAAWIPAITTLFGVICLFQQSDDSTNSTRKQYNTELQQPVLRRGRRLRFSQKLGYGSSPYQYRSTTVLSRKTQRRHRPETESPLLSIFCFQFRTILRLAKRRLSTIMADQDFLLQALPSYMPQAANGTTPGGIPLNPIQQTQTTESHPSQQ